MVGAWVISSIVGMFPYLMWGGEFSVINAWFESVSGFTTTGASILNDIEALPRGLQFWLMSTCWIGGVGVIMFALVILPSIGKSKMILSNVEISSLAKDNFNYRTQTIVRIILSIFVGLTVITTVALKLSGMCWFDAVCHAMSATSTCGFGTKNTSIAFFDSQLIEIVLMTTMTISGIHYGLIYATLSNKPNNIFRSEVVRVYVGIIVVATLFQIHLAKKVGPIPSLLFAFVLTGWIGMASRVRMQFYRFKGQEYILAARTLGARDTRLMFKHIFPNSLGTIITGTVLVIPGVIFSESSMTYLGIVNLESSTMTSVGTMLANGRNYLSTDPYIILFPALFISLLEISFNLFGNGLRDAFNPSLRGAE